MFEAHEARIYSIDIDKTNTGGAAECTACPLGTKQKASPSQECAPCGMGKQSDESDRYACEACPAGTFSADDIGQCNPCGNHTLVDASATGCKAEPAGLCKFAGDVSGRAYDLTPLGENGGNMTYGGKEGIRHN